MERSVNILKQIRTEGGWRRVPLQKNLKGQIRWDNRPGTYLIEWRENGQRLRKSAGTTPSEACHAQKIKEFELNRADLGFEASPSREEQKLPLSKSIQMFLDDIRTFRKPLTYQKYQYVLELFAKYCEHDCDMREITPDDVKVFLSWRKFKGCDPGTTLYTDRVILHNFFNKLGIENPVKKVPRLAKFRKRPSSYPDDQLHKFFSHCNDWERSFFSLALATGLRRGELQTLHWSDLDLLHRRVHVRAKPQYGFVPKDWEERSIPFSREVASILSKHVKLANCPLVFPSPKSHLNYRFLHDRCKEIASRAGLNPAEWHLHRFRDTAATRWLRAGIDVRTVQDWLGHESLATTQKYLEPSIETERQLEDLKLPL